MYIKQYLFIYNHYAFTGFVETLTKRWLGLNPHSETVILSVGPVEILKTDQLENLLRTIVK